MNSREKSVSQNITLSPTQKFNVLYRPSRHINMFRGFTCHPILPTSNSKPLPLFVNTGFHFIIQCMWDTTVSTVNGFGLQVLLQIRLSSKICKQTTSSKHSVIELLPQALFLNQVGYKTTVRTSHYWHKFPEVCSLHLNRSRSM